ncbi:PadR family transcriptional regulator [Kineosporia sp. R_H_3]|uniref:PadR family transcriptional regulator n=1 Tax=Kineosporia sp. R_H_3 TaxID=1961848 RepID=UPI000B4AD3E4|nr:PadR family transcriptional regulator [Kineosporia sp. R_H_3]
MAGHDPQMLKGVLSLLLLELCAQQEDYGYALVVRLQGLGFPELAEGTVYPALSRLESQGLLEARLVRSASGPARKYYTPTAAGAAERVRARQAWDALVVAVAAVRTDSVRTQEVPT